jgi:thiol:disulfide interchange protein DsbC
MKKFTQTLLASTLLLAATTAYAAPTPANEALVKKLAEVGIVPTEISETPIHGLKEITTNQGIIYASDNGDYFVVGNLFKNESPRPINITEQKEAKINAVKLMALESSMIVYPAKDQKYVVTVFTDTSCGYCRKLHQEIQGYNDLGITVRYLAFPRGGERSRNLQEMSAIWAAENKLDAMTLAKAGKFTPTGATFDNSVVMKHYELGMSMGISGTPAIILENGTVIPGYQPPAQLLKILQNRPA